MSESNKKEYSLLASNSETQTERPQPKKVNAAKPGSARRIYIICVVAVSVLLSVFICARLYISFNEQLVYELKIEETDLTGIEDGVYSGSYSSSHMSATVSVSIENESIVALTLDEYTSIDPARASEVFDAVIYYQMLNVPGNDVGTQVSDIIVLKAIEATVAAAASNAVSSV